MLETAKPGLGPADRQFRRSRSEGAKDHRAGQRGTGFGESVSIAAGNNDLV
jgi:hypothetical protein